MLPKTSGIYTITNLINNKLYVGYTINFRSRKWTHFSKLRNNKHCNPHLQRAFNEYGEENFLYEILEECEEQYLVAMEHYWCIILKSHEDNYGYNDKPTHPEKAHYKPSEAAKLKISNTLLLKNKDKIKVIKKKRYIKKLFWKRKGRPIVLINLLDNSNIKFDTGTEAGKYLGVNGRRLLEIVNRPTWTIKNHVAVDLDLFDNQKIYKKEKIVFSQETYAKRSLKTTGQKRSEECKQKMSDKRFKRIVLKYDLNMNLIAEYESVLKAAKENNCWSKSISDCCTIEGRKFQEHYWKYK